MKNTLWLLIALVTTTPVFADSCLNPEFAAGRLSGVSALINAAGLVQQIVVTDLNGDSNTDVVAISAGCAFCAPALTNHLSVLLSHGDGTFATNVNYALNAFPTSVAAGDLNGDLRADLVVSFVGTTLASVYLNNGDGTFQAPTTVNIGNSQEALTLADLRADGNLDLIGGTASIASGNGNGTFQSSQVITGGVSGILPVVGDFDGDTKVDLATISFDLVGNQSFLVTVLGAANPPFQVITNSPVGVLFTALAAGNFNADTSPDIAAICGSNFVSVCLSKGNGSFQTNVNYAVPTNAIALAVADFNGDHTSDIAVLQNNNLISILLGNGNGTFQPAFSYAFRGDGIAGHLAVGDINNDGIPDLITGNTAVANGIRVILGNGDGTFQFAPAYPVGHGPLNPVAADFNSDGFRDLVVANNFSNNISVLLNNGDGTFATNVNYTVGNAPDSIAVADYNKDGKLDLIVANTLSNRVFLRLGNSNGTFQTNTVAATVVVGSYGAVTGDFNNDGNPDFAGGGLSANFLAGMHVYLGNGNGTFRTNITTTTTPLTTSGDVVHTGDFNNDGKLDIAYAKAGSNIVCVILGRGDGTFGVNNNFPMGGTNLNAFTVADLNTDGKLDLITANYDCLSCNATIPHGTLAVRLGNGNGTFQPPLLTPLNAYLPWGMVTGDFNGDGKPDIAVADLSVNEVWVFLGKGNGTFDTPVRFGTQLSPGTLCAADLDANGTIDLVTANQAVDTLSVLLNNCPFAPPGVLSLALTPLLATNTVGTTHTVTATITSNGTAKAGILVNFTVTGVNANSGTATTGVAGQGSFTYTGNNVGTDTIRAIAGGVTSTVTKVWIAGGGGCPTITLSPNSLNAGTVSTAYSQKITATGGQAPYTFAVTTGTLPGNLNLSNAGTLSGTPTNQGVFGFTITATDANSCTGSQAYALTINPAPPTPHDLAVVILKAPKKITLKGVTTPKPGKVAVTIQNLSTHTETITNLVQLQSIVVLNVESLGTCPVPVITLTPPKTFPVILKPKKKLKLAYLAAITCPNDPLPVTKADPNHADYRFTGQVNHAALDGEADTIPSNDLCPRGPNGTDKGCGNKNPVTKQLGADVLTDVVQK